MNRICLTVALILVLAGSATAQNSKIEEARRKLAERRAAAAAHTGHKTGSGAPAAATAAPAATGDSSTENFQIGIEYRGAIKKTDDNIGNAVMRCRTTGQDAFEVVLNGHAVVPGKKKKNEPIDFEITRQFKMEGNVAKNVGGTEKFSNAAEKYKTKILNMLALAYLIKFRSPIYGTDAQPAAVTWEVDARRYQCDYVRLGKPGAWRETQVTLIETTENNRLHGKFFLAPSAAAPSPFKKFRIQTKEKLGINFFTI